MPLQVPSVRATYATDLLLTVVIVVNLVLGMLLIAADMQRHILNPLERMTKIMKIVTGRKWRKKFGTLKGRDKADGKGGSGGKHGTLRRKYQYVYPIPPLLGLHTHVWG